MRLFSNLGVKPLTTPIPNNSFGNAKPCLAAPIFAHRGNKGNNPARRPNRQISIHKLLIPQFQRDHRPQNPCMILCAVDMCINHLSQHIHIVKAPVPDLIA